MMFKSKLQYIKYSELNCFLALSVFSKFTSFMMKPHTVMVPLSQPYSAQTFTAG